MGILRLEIKVFVMAFFTILLVAGAIYGATQASSGGGSPEEAEDINTRRAQKPDRKGSATQQESDIVGNLAGSLASKSSISKQGDAKLDTGGPGGIATATAQFGPSPPRAIEFGEDGVGVRPNTQIEFGIQPGISSLRGDESRREDLLQLEQQERKDFDPEEDFFGL